MKSGLQKQVLSLYRQLLKASSAQSNPSVRDSLKQYFRNEFKSKALELSYKDITAIEHQIRLGERKLDFLKEHLSLKRFSF